MATEDPERAVAHSYLHHGQIARNFKVSPTRCASSSVVEQLVYTQLVGGSTPSSRTTSNQEEPPGFGGGNVPVLTLFEVRPRPIALAPVRDALDDVGVEAFSLHPLGCCGGIRAHP